MDVRDAVEGMLRARGADGLVNEREGCSGCPLGDLMPGCSATVVGGCVPAIEAVCPSCGSSMLVSCERLLGEDWGRR